FFQAEDGIRDFHVTGVQTCALPICLTGVAGIVIGDAEVVHGAVIARRQFGSAAQLVDRADEVALVGVEHAEVVSGAPVVAGGGDGLAPEALGLGELVLPVRLLGLGVEAGGLHGAGPIVGEALGQ